jgi:hypothetical protein
MLICGVSPLPRFACAERAFAAAEVATLLDLRRAVRNSTVWIEHSLAFRSRETLFIPQRRDRAIDTGAALCKVLEFVDVVFVPLAASLELTREVISVRICRLSPKEHRVYRCHIQIVLLLKLKLVRISTQRAVCSFVRLLRFLSSLINIFFWPMRVI